ncbi:CaiB/BaiF CoA transferase family protein [Pseudonocardia spinosispora]|uniref:CaiB/BaiF CoA transferase family protein n=1 Tax=Pseudonocardia spinosispora TaxID=103441 RepID=UPI00041D7BD4|nr:CoA transferase [Pseudonocardia spinosispora]
MTDAQTGDTRGHGPLHGLRVLDLTTTFMGPYATMLMAQMGADVIKVEAPAGDITRGISDYRGLGMGPVFLNANRGKRSITLDLKQDADRALLLRLAGTVDVFVHNMRPAAARRAGIEYPAIAEVNPGCVYCSLPGFDSTGPERDRPAYDDVIQAASGFAWVQGNAYVRTPVADKTVGTLALGAILAALYERSGSGRGQAVEVPMFESMAAFLLLDQQGGWVFDPPAGPVGYARTSSPHRRPYETSDGHLGVLVYTDAQWRAFFSLAGRPEMADDPRFRSIAGRTEHIDELYALVAEVLRTRSTDEWRRVLEAANIPATPVNSVTDLFTDPQALASGLFETHEHPTLGTLRQPRLPARFSRTGAAPAASAPELGEHAEQIRAELDQRHRTAHTVPGNGVC